GHVQEGKSELRIIRICRPRAGEMFRRFCKVTSVAIESAEIVMRLHVRRVRLEHTFKLCDGLCSLALLCQHPAQIVVSTYKCRVEFDRSIEFGNRLLSST